MGEPNVSDSEKNLRNLKLRLEQMSKTSWIVRRFGVYDKNVYDTIMLILGK